MVFNMKHNRLDKQFFAQTKTARFNIDPVWNEHLYTAKIGHDIFGRFHGKYVTYFFANR